VALVVVLVALLASTLVEGLALIFAIGAIT
jgi:hypothetical protein